MIGSILRMIVRMPTVLLILFVRFYQVCISPLMPSVCRFRPSCSAYFIQSVKKHGAIRGSLKGAWRICRCNPFSAGGHDPP